MDGIGVRVKKKKKKERSSEPEEEGWRKNSHFQCTSKCYAIQQHSNTTSVCSLNNYHRVESQSYQKWNVTGFTKGVLIAERLHSYITQVLLLWWPPAVNVGSEHALMLCCCLPVVRLKRWTIVQTSEWASVTWSHHSVPVYCSLMLGAFFFFFFYFHFTALVSSYFNMLKTLTSGS